MKTFIKKLPAGKIKVLLTAVMTVCMILQGTVVSAADSNEITLSASGNEAGIELYFPQAAAEEIASMQISVKVTADVQGTDLEYIPDSSLSGRIVESRYQSSTGTLNIYIAGTTALFSPDGHASVGTVRISSDSTAAATVEVAENSVKFVRNGEIVSPGSDTVYPRAVTLKADGQTSPVTPENPVTPVYPVTPENPVTPVTPVTPENPVTPVTPVDPTTPVTPVTPTVPGNVYPGRPTGNFFPDISVSTPTYGIKDNVTETLPPEPENADILYDGEDDAEYDTPNLSPENSYPAETGIQPLPPDLTALYDAISRAGSYREADYSPDSYAALAEAVNKARSVADDPASTQSEIDEAQLNIENAIGMLTLRNDIPSGAEGYAADNAQPSGEIPLTSPMADNAEVPAGQVYVPGDDGAGIALPGVPEPAAKPTPQVQQSQPGITAADNARSVSSELMTETETAGSSAMWLLIPAIAIAAAAVAVIKKVIDKKAADGKHYKFH